MKTDSELKKDVTSELEWEPSINASHVGVVVNKGVVTLTGHLDTYVEKYAIERVVSRVEGVKAIAVEVDVKLEPSYKRSDTEIALAAESAFKWHTGVPEDQIQVRVEKGLVTLKGEVDWEYQRRNAEKAVRSLTGVTGVINSILLKARTTPENVVSRIQDAFTRHAASEAKHIEVIVHGSVATLRGKVESWPQRDAAVRAAWTAPGITNVVNELIVSW